MFRQLWIFTFLTCVFLDCAVFSNSWPSGDYVPIAGLVCNSPEMVDGNMNTSDLVYIGGSVSVRKGNKAINAIQIWRSVRIIRSRLLYF